MPDTESPKDENSTGTADCLYLAALPNPPVPLPRVPGPKLAPFTPTAHAKIDFIEELGDPQNDQDARVWKVLIDGDGPYALKMFRFLHSEYLSHAFAGELNRALASPQSYVDFFDPFSCECRAYGRLKEAQREDVAVRAHGYLLLTPTQEAEITTKSWGERYKPDVEEDELNSTKPWHRSEQHRYLPIRCIVKDLATSPEHFTPSQIKTMWRDLEHFHRLGILVRDIGVGNFIGGKIIDLSRAWTTPHPAFMYLEEYQLDEHRRLDLQRLRHAIIDFADGEGWDWRQVKIPEDLTKCESGKGEGELDRFGVDPRLYDWRKWEEDPAEADRFIEEEMALEDDVVDGEQLELRGE